MNHLLYLFLKKTKLNKGLYHLCKAKSHEQIPICPKEVEKAQTLLNTLHADPHNSCISLIPQHYYKIFFLST